MLFDEKQFKSRLSRVFDANGLSSMLNIERVEKFVALTSYMLEENEKYIRDLLPHVCHWFTVDDLVYLKRGGRISPAAAFFGNMLGIKPVLHVDDEGHLVAVSKVRGRKTAIEALAAKYTELAESLDGPVFVSHADCQRDVDTLNEIITARRGRGIDIIENVGTVIGAHSGPGTLALFFIGKIR